MAADREPVHHITVALLTDFGQSDAYAGILSGVILGNIPPALRQYTTIVSVTHGIPPQDIASAAWALHTCLGHFPRNTIFVCIVDPGVGDPTQEKLLLHSAEAGYSFIGPDNGLFSPALIRYSDIHGYRLPNKPEKENGHTFYGRDIYAPAAGHWAIQLLQDKEIQTIQEDRGYKPIPIESLTYLPAWQQVPYRQGDALWGHVIHIDTYGNIITTIPNDWLAPSVQALQEVKTNGQKGPVFEVRRFYREGEGLPNRPFILYGSSGTLEIALTNQSAQKQLGLQRGALIGLTPNQKGF